jgi:hypothetical protein
MVSRVKVMMRVRRSVTTEYGWQKNRLTWDSKLESMLSMNSRYSAVYSRALGQLIVTIM